MIPLILTKEKDLPFLNGLRLCDKLGNLLKLLRAILLEACTEPAEVKL
jgi:hypothetical protein